MAREEMLTLHSYEQYIFNSVNEVIRFSPSSSISFEHRVGQGTSRSSWNTTAFPKYFRSKTRTLPEDKLPSTC